MNETERNAHPRGIRPQRRVRRSRRALPVLALCAPIGAALGIAGSPAWAHSAPAPSRSAEAPTGATPAAARPSPAQPDAARSAERRATAQEPEGPEAGRGERPAKVDRAAAQRARAEGIDAVQRGEFALAEQRLLDAVAGLPDDSEARFSLGYAQARLGHAAEARRTFRIVAEGADQRLATEALFNLGGVSMQEGATAAAAMRALLEPADAASAQAAPPGADPGALADTAAAAEALREVAVERYREALRVFGDLALIDPADRDARLFAERCARALAALEPPDSESEQQDGDQSQQGEQPDQQPDQQQDQESGRGEDQGDPSEQSQQGDGAEGDRSRPQQDQGQQGDQSGQRDQSGQSDQDQQGDGTSRTGEPRTGEQGDSERGDDRQGERSPSQQERDRAEPHDGRPDSSGAPEPQQRQRPDGAPPEAPPEGELSEDQHAGGQGAAASDPAQRPSAAQPTTEGGRTIELTPEQMERLLQGVRDRERARLLQQAAQRRRTPPPTDGRSW